MSDDFKLTDLFQDEDTFPASEDREAKEQQQAASLAFLLAAPSQQIDRMTRLAQYLDARAGSAPALDVAAEWTKEEMEQALARPKDYDDTLHASRKPYFELSTTGTEPNQTVFVCNTRSAEKHLLQKSNPRDRVPLNTVGADHATAIAAFRGKVEPFYPEEHCLVTVERGGADLMPEARTLAWTHVSWCSGEENGGADDGDTLPGQQDPEASQFANLTNGRGQVIPDLTLTEWYLSTSASNEGSWYPPRQKLCRGIPKPMQMKSHIISVEIEFSCKDPARLERKLRKYRGLAKLGATHRVLWVINDATSRLVYEQFEALKFLDGRIHQVIGDGDLGLNKRGHFVPASIVEEFPNLRWRIPFGTPRAPDADAQDQAARVAASLQEAKERKAARQQS